MGALLGCTMAALALASSSVGVGARGVETVVQDDATLLHRSDAATMTAMTQIAALGADRVRITAGWSVLAPAPRSRRAPGKPFIARDSSTYPQAGFGALDRAVRDATIVGLKVQLDLAFWAPRWAVERPQANSERQRTQPSPQAFADFAHAVASRYSGRNPGLPAVRTFTTWNEPNHPSFLQPQWTRDSPRGKWRPLSPHLYRRMHEAAYREVKRVSPDNQVLVGGLSSFGSHVPGRGAVPPLEFLRTMACVTRDLKPLHVPECRHAGTIHADGLAYHPYTLDVTPGTHASHPDDAYLADLPRLERLVAALHRKGRIDRDWGLYLTEYGYETSPPDPTASTSLTQQAMYLGWASAIVQRDPHVKLFAQFLLRDIDPADSGYKTGDVRRWRDWQTGLLYADGRPKPAALAFELPLYGWHDRGRLVLAGGVRPGAGAQVVQVERFDTRTRAWQPVSTSGPNCGTPSLAFPTDASGFFSRTAPWRGPGRYRLSWLRPDGSWAHGPDLPIGGPPLIEPRRHRRG